MCFMMPHQRLSLQPIMRKFCDWDSNRLGGALLYGADDDVDIYVRHNEYVRRVVPKERLLEFEPSMGWKPVRGF
jgi:hypothetical protein